MSREYSAAHEIGPALLASYTTTFLSRHDLYPIQLDNGTYVSVRKELTDNIVAAHLKGYMTIGAYALDASGWAKWICFDADDEKRWKGLLRLAQRIEKEAAVRPYLEQSRRGGHLWIFTPTLPGFQVRRFGKQLLAEQKLKGIELYPKQDKPKSGPGSLVRLPLGIHKMTGKRYHFINLDGTPLAPTIREQIKIFANPKRIPSEFIEEVLQRVPNLKALSPIPPLTGIHDQAASGTPSERIKAAMPVYDFVSQYVELEPNGKGYCPFHDDQHKSFQVNREENYWNCYAGCGGGSIIDFWAKWRGMHHQDMSFKATIGDLAKKLL